MPGWDVKIRPGKDEEKKDDNSATWVIVVILGLLLLWWLHAGGAFGLSGCGVYQDGIHCDQGQSSGGSPSSPSSGHHRHHP